MDRIIAFIGLLVSLLAFQGPSCVLGQERFTGEPRDTSYFKPGEDDWNLVESVLRTDPGALLFLLRRGADPDARAEGGMTALMFAAEKGDTMLVKILLLNGAQPDLTYVEGTSPLMVAVLSQQFDAAHLLLQRGADPNHVDEFGSTSLIYAAALNNFALADLLIFYGADPEKQDKQGNTALMTAVGLAHMETTDVLLQNGSLPDTPDKKQNTPLMLAAQKGDREMLSILLEYGASLEATNAGNYTALAHAVHNGQKEFVQALVDSSANVHHKISPRRNLYDLALMEGQQEVQQILRKAGAEPTPRPDFGEFAFGWGNSFARNEHLMQARLWWLDTKFGFFMETGFDIRPIPRYVQVEENNDLVYQYRENRWAWSHGAGKFFTLARDETGIEYGFYAALYGMLSVPSYRGVDDGPGAQYNLVPSAGIFLNGTYAGIKAGAERYHFGSLLEGKWKTLITLYVRLPYNTQDYEIKTLPY